MLSFICFVLEIHKKINVLFTYVFIVCWKSAKVPWPFFAANQMSISIEHEDTLRFLSFFPTVTSHYAN